MNVLGATYNAHVICLTSDISNTLNVTLAGLVSLMKLLLSHGFSYVLAGNFRSDRVEENLEFIDSHQLDVTIKLCNK